VCICHGHSAIPARQAGHEGHRMAHIPCMQTTTYAVPHTAFTHTHTHTHTHHAWARSRSLTSIHFVKVRPLQPVSHAKEPEHDQETKLQAPHTSGRLLLALRTVVPVQNLQQKSCASQPDEDGLEQEIRCSSQGSDGCRGECQRGRTHHAQSGLPPSK
jgi:hypothetical protein